MGWPPIPELLCLICVLSCTSPGDANGNILGPDWTYQVNNMNLLDRLRGSPSISPRCAAALAGVRVNGSRAARAELVSGRVIESIALMETLFIGHLQANSTTRDLLPLALQYASPFSSLGKPEVCRDYYIPGFHYCRMDVLRWAYRVGACLPIGCNGDDVLDTLLPKIDLLKGETYSICGTHHFPPITGTYAMAAVLLVLAGLVLIGTVLDVKKTGDPERARGKSARKRACLAFSVKRNVAALLRPTKDGPLAALDGVRSLSMCLTIVLVHVAIAWDTMGVDRLWIILGHCYTLVLAVNYPSDSERMTVAPDHKAFIQRWSAQIIWTAWHAVDTFLFITGFLAMRSLLPYIIKTRARHPQKWLMTYLLRDAPAMILRRIIRISPSYYVTLGVYICLASTLVTTTPYTYLEADLRACHRYWWQNLLYIQNLRAHDMTRSCYASSWYMAVDVQLFLTLPLLGLIAAYNRYACLAVCVISMAAISTLAVLESVRHDWSLNILDYDYHERLLDADYIKPWYQAPSYLLGVMSGVVWVEWGEVLQQKAADPSKRARNAALAALVFAVGCTLIGLVVYGFTAFAQMIVTDRPQTQVAVYTGTDYMAFSLGLAFVLFLVFLGLDYGVLRALLTWRPLVLLARISFCIYLVHFGIMLVVLSAEPGQYPFSDVRFIFDYVGYVAASIILGLVLHLVVERPFSNLEAVLGSRASKRRHEKGVVVLSACLQEHAALAIDAGHLELEVKGYQEEDHVARTLEQYNAVQ